MLILVANPITLQNNMLKRLINVYLELESTIWGRGSRLENPQRINSSSFLS
jgi:hypothetical protein